MTIYATPFTDSNKTATARSRDSGFESLDQVVAMMGQPVKLSPRVAIYGEGEERIAYSDFAFTFRAGKSSTLY